MKQWMLNAVMGLIMMIGGAWLAVYEQQHPPVHSGHLYLFIGIALLGALLINPQPIIGSVKQVVVVLLPVIPWSKPPRPSGTASAPPEEKTDG